MSGRLAGLLGVLWICTLGWTYRFASENVHNAVQAAAVTSLVANVEQHNRKADEGLAVEKQVATRQAATEANFQRIEEEVLTYAEKHAGDVECGLDADGLRIWNAANANTEPKTASPGEPDRGLPGTAHSDERQEERAAGQPRTGGEAVPQMPGEPSRLSELDQGEVGMSDYADDALKSEEESRQRALDAQLGRAGQRAKTVEDSAAECTVCDDAIPEPRRHAVPGVQTCFDCQGELERAMHAHTRGYP